jgi:hypothetical protein
MPIAISAGGELTLPLRTPLPLALSVRWSGDASGGSIGWVVYLNGNFDRG